MTAKDVLLSHYVESAEFINENVPVMSNESPSDERFLLTEAWTHSDFLYKNYILSGLQDDLYNVYNNFITSKELWDALEKKYKIEDVGMKKFIVAKFLDYKMIDSKTVVTQVQELQVIIHDLLAEGINLFNAYVVNIKFILNTYVIFNVGLIVNYAFKWLKWLP